MIQKSFCFCVLDNVPFDHLLLPYEFEFSLQQYLLEKVEKQNVATKPIDIEKPENQVNAASEEVVDEKVEGEADSVAEGTEVSTLATTALDASAENTDGVSVTDIAEGTPATEESNEPSEEENSSNEEAAEETPEIKVNYPSPAD